MARPEPADPSAGGEGQAALDVDARQVRILKIVVISLGILLLVGFGVVIARIAYLATQPAGGIGGTASPRDIRLALPPGATIRSTAVSGDRMTVQYESPQQTGIIIINLTTGQIVSRIGLQPEAPRQ